MLSRILAVDPTSRGFGYVVVENGRLIDWGTACVRPNSNARVLQRFSELALRMQPDLVVVENYSDAGCRRSSRLQGLMKSITQRTQSQICRVRLVSISNIQGRFASIGARTKHQRACWIATQVPELAPRLPPVRKAWMSEDERMSIFDAAALAFPYLSDLRKSIAPINRKRASA